MLFPVRLVGFEVLRDWECFDGDTGKDSAREIREYFIPDLSNGIGRTTTRSRHRGDCRSESYKRGCQVKNTSPCRYGRDIFPTSSPQLS